MILSKEYYFALQKNWIYIAFMNAWAYLLSQGLAGMDIHNFFEVFAGFFLGIKWNFTVGLVCSCFSCKIGFIFLKSLLTVGAFLVNYLPIVSLMYNSGQQNSSVGKDTCCQVSSTQVQSPESTWWKERINFRMLSSDLHIYAMTWGTPIHPH